MKIFAIANQKGGVGKTTTTVNLAAALAELGHPTLLIDLDPQANATSAVGVAPEAALGNSLYPVFLGERRMSDQIVGTAYPNLSIIPCETDLAGCEVEIARREQPLTALRDLFVEFKKEAQKFEFILIDCPPSLGILMTNALAAADAVLVPLQCEYFALEGLSKILNLINQIRANNPALYPVVGGVILTMYDARTNLSQQVAADVRQHVGEVTFQTIIPRTVRLAEAPSHGKPVLNYDSSGIGAQSYRQLAKEFLTRCV